MNMFIEEINFDGYDYTFLYQYLSEDEFKKKIESIMLDRGYKYKGDHVYERGNGTLRLFLGAFHRHYKMEIAPKFLDDNKARITIRKCSTGFAGGLIGLHQIKKELKALGETFKSL